MPTICVSVNRDLSRAVSLEAVALGFRTYYWSHFRATRHVFPVVLSRLGRKYAISGATMATNKEEAKPSKACEIGLWTVIAKSF